MTVENSFSLSKQATFTEINLEEIQRKKLPKRLVYFSDGVLEEYSSDEECEVDANDTQPLIDPKTLTWVPYFGYLVWLLGSRTLAVCDYLGEHLAWFFGITSPKFQYEIDQYEKMAKEEEELEKRVSAEMAGWKSSDTGDEQNKTIKQQPHSAGLTCSTKQAESRILVSTSKDMDSTSQVPEKC
ncbi:protein FAM177A1-like [Uloborus diversus]|uniref:protein FAM177A1-like n=1 Tax=Uloborus diversus TaxID=327109 RepID=UPI00240A7AC2|nr:protein FAM177A1-like [Uloborus diversus]